MADVEEERTYGSLVDVEHVLLRPTMYIGDVNTLKTNDWIFHDNKFVWREGVLWNEGLMKIISEVIDNVVDEGLSSVNPATVMKVEVDETRVTISNDGASIPIRAEQKVAGGAILPLPTALFGVPRTGSKFTKNRPGIGQFGWGVKLTNVFSTSFDIACVHDGEIFKQRWTDHMRVRGDHTIKKAPKKTSGVTTVSFTPDLEFFNKLNEGREQLTSMCDFIPVIETRLVQIAATHPRGSLRIYLNGKLIKCPDFRSYIKLFHPERYLFDGNEDGSFQYGLMVSPTGTYQHQSFVNCQRTTSDKSSQVRYVTNAVVKVISNALGGKLSAAAISTHLFVFVKLRIADATFNTQNKTELVTQINPKLYPIDDAKVLSLCKTSGLLDKLHGILRSKTNATVDRAVAAGGKTLRDIESLEDAGDAGTVRSPSTTLFVVEGESARTMVVVGMSVVGNAKYGVFPIKGKSLNVAGVTEATVVANKELFNIMRILGLDFRKEYRTVEERSHLRYGNMCIMTDADIDGYHVTGL